MDRTITGVAPFVTSGFASIFVVLYQVVSKNLLVRFRWKLEVLRTNFSSVGPDCTTNRSFICTAQRYRQLLAVHLFWVVLQLFGSDGYQF